MPLNAKPMKLVIVESPTKARAIQGFLGEDYHVVSSFGHVRDLPKSKLGVDTEHDFTPGYVIPTKARKTVSALKKAAQHADVLIMATDEDREGEAIAWHLVQVLGLNASSQQPTFSPREKGRVHKKPGVESQNPHVAIARIVFHEITKRAIEEALENPREININLVNAQQARRILDRLVGYELSPFLWKKVAKGLSAGRVQSVAVRLIVDRERERKNFISEEYWTIVASLLKIKNRRSEIKDQEFKALLVRINNETIPKLGIKTKEEADAIIKDLADATYTIARIEKREVAKNPFAPFTTSTLQQDSWRRLRMSAKFTMRIAQQLYEGINLGDGQIGLITYMRTDSVNIAASAQHTAKEFIETAYGKTYSSPRTFKTKSRLAQEAHEAIRPTDPRRAPQSIKECVDERQYKLYDLIWRRFIASQMSPASFDVMSADIETTSERNAKTYTFRATGQTMKFDGFLKVYPLKFEETMFPELNKGEILECSALVPDQHFTQPPPRYSEATLVKALEKEGIGRPSTYAPIMSTIQERGYIEKDEKRYFMPTEVGILVNDLLVEHFPAIVDIAFSAKMEEDLDTIAEGKTQWVPVVKNFYDPFKETLDQKYHDVAKYDLTEPSDEVCEKCGKPMVIKLGKFGKFLACSGFPECKNAKNIERSTHVACPKCDEGEIGEKRSRRGRVFYGCNRWPKCNYALWSRPTGEKCPECGSLLVEERKGTKCSNKECGGVQSLVS